MRDGFASLHPGVLLLYFAIVIATSMFVLHPVFLGISLLSGIAYALLLGRGRALRFLVATALPVIVLFTLVNPVLNHAGATVLVSVGGLPVTLESLVYGLVSGSMFASVIIWFYCSNHVVDPDAPVHLLGRLAPSIALLVSMVIGLVPRYSRQVRAIIRSQRGIGCDASTGSVGERARRGLKVVSILATWALENSVDTADSMRSRGYGLPGRTRYARFRFTPRDAAVTAGLLLAAFVAVSACAAGSAAAASYFPRLEIDPSGTASLVAYAAWTLICLFPLIIDGLEELSWMRSLSRI